ncbi:MAG: efflux RND transporter periplasmic adaptor subunit [Amphiplicatus sp.]|uniref:efflux RND transporter periplasmic adaptor subunit n=1 Tax=Methylocystis sp. TaxID=1911079 RepID=UPI003D13C215
MRLSNSVKTALVILAAFVLYFGARALFAGAKPDKPAAPESELFAVVAREIGPVEWRDEVRIRGRAEALRKIVARAETAGVVEATPAEPGVKVEAGAPLCRLKIDARRAALDEARAAFAKAKLDYSAAAALAKEGFRSETAVAAAKAARDLAKANLEQAEVAVEKTVIAAPWAGIFDERLAETGDYLKIGDPCGVVIQQTPFLIVGAVSERDVVKISQGDKGTARLASGETVEGVVRFVAKAADEATRTFEVQLETPNEDGAIRDGMTADFTVFAGRGEAHLAPRSALTLDDEGRIGVRLVGADDIVDFAPVRLLGEAADGVYVAGLHGDVRLIIRGQDFVKRGQKVAVAAEEAGA